MISSHHSFITRQDLPVGADLIEACVDAISIVTTKHIVFPTRYTVDFTRVMLDETSGLPLYAAAFYQPDQNRFAFALESDEFRQISVSGIPQIAAIILLGAHEAGHSVQVDQGLTLRPSLVRESDSYVTRSDYHEDIAEYDAWTEAAHVLKKLVPTSEGSFLANAKTYTIPKKSRYD